MSDIETGVELSPKDRIRATSSIGQGGVIPAAIPGEAP